MNLPIYPSHPRISHAAPPPGSFFGPVSRGAYRGEVFAGIGRRDPVNIFAFEGSYGDSAISSSTADNVVS